MARAPSILVFCSAPEADVRRAVKEAANGAPEGSILWFAPAGSVFAADHSLVWGAGPFTWRRVLQWGLKLRSSGFHRVILPLHNADGAGYGALRFLARWLSPHAVEVPKQGAPRPLGWDTVFDGLETAWHALALAVLETAAPLLRLWLRRHVPAPDSRPRPAMRAVTVQDFYADSPPEISIIIRTYNEERYLAATLEQIARQRGPAREIIVIDSESTDRTADIACSFPVRVYRVSKTSFNYSAALNLGARLARGRLLVHVSAHSIPIGDTWLESLVQPLADARIAGVCGREMPIEGWASPFERKLLSDLFRDTPRVMTDSFFFSNANAAVRRERVLEVPFDEAVDWGEDQVWAHAMHRQGHLTAYTPRSAVAHSHNLSMAQCFARTLKFQRTLFRRMYRDRVEQSCSQFRRQLAGRARAFRRFMTQHRLVSGPWALVYAPFCEYVNYLGCETARREWRANKLAAGDAPAVYAVEQEAVAP